MRELFCRLPFELTSLSELGVAADVEETGSTFAANAEIKALEYSRLSGALCLADDSGLEVDALGGAPGVFSARFAGPDADYEMKIAQLLSMLEASGSTDRTARFVCAMSLAEPHGRILHAVEGVVEGSIANAPRGTHGFGYDPVFIPSGYQLTFGELGDDVKQLISHRARAAELIIRFLLDFTGLST
jgi:XTP/dITP diphosphohydrolase